MLSWLLWQKNQRLTNTQLMRCLCLQIGCFGNMHFSHDRFYRVFGLCLRPEHLPSFCYVITPLCFYFVNQNHRTPNYFKRVNLWTLAPQSSVWSGSHVCLSELRLPIARWAAGSSALSSRAGGGGGGGRVFGLETQWGWVNAVALPCGFWSVIKQVSQMSSTLQHRMSFSSL